MNSPIDQNRTRIDTPKCGRLVVAFCTWLLCITGNCLGQNGLGKSPEPVKQESSSPGAIDLLKRIDLKRDTISGEFRLERGKLITPRARSSRLNLSYQPPRDYDVVVEAKRTDDGKGHLVFLLILDGKQVLVMLDSFWTQVSGLTVVDGLDLDAAGNDSAYRKTVLPLGETRRLRFVVRGPRLQILAGETRIVDWGGKLSRLTVPAHWSTPNPKILMVGGGDTEFEIARLELVPVVAIAASPPEGASTSKIDGVLEAVKVAIPNQSAQADARKTILELFKKEFDQAKNAKGKTALAQTLLSRAGDLQNDPAGLYAILSESAENAAAAGDLPLALKAIEEVDLHFATPAFEMKEKVAKISAPLAKTPDQILSLVEMHQSLIREALAADEIAIAERSGQAAMTLSRKPGMAILKDQLVAVSKDIATHKSNFQTADTARRTLKEKPDDPAATLAWGKYLCFVKGNWIGGLPLLIKSGDAMLAELAKRDLEQPVGADENILLGDDWWVIGEQEKEPSRTNIWLHAVESYNRALPNLTGLNLSSTERKISRLFSNTQVFASTGDPMGTPLADAALNLGTNATVECWIQTLASENVLFSKRIQEPEGTLAVRLYGGRACFIENASFHYREARTETILNDGVWHHIAIVKAGTNAALFVDGKPAAKLEVRNQLSSKSPWTVGVSIGFEPISVKACRFRISNIPRYIVSFKPDYNYKADRATVFFTDSK